MYFFFALFLCAYACRYNQQIPSMRVRRSPAYARPSPLPLPKPDPLRIQINEALASIEVSVSASKKYEDLIKQELQAEADEIKNMRIKINCLC